MPLDFDASWDLHPDGDRIVLAKPVEASTEEEAVNDDFTPDAVYLVVNWFDRVRAAFADEGGS